MLSFTKRSAQHTSYIVGNFMPLRGGKTVTMHFMRSMMEQLP